MAAHPSPRIPIVVSPSWQWETLLACPPLCPWASNQACPSKAGTPSAPTASCLDVCQLPGLSPSPREAEASGCFQGAGNTGIAGCELSADDSRVISPEIRLSRPDMKALWPSHGERRVLSRARDLREAGDTAWAFLTLFPWVMGP